MKLIDKAAVVAEIERRLCLLVPKMTFHRQRVELEKLLSFLDTLETIEVDLEREVNSYMVNEIKTLNQFNKQKEDGKVQNRT